MSDAIPLDSLLDVEGLVGEALLGAVEGGELGLQVSATMGGTPILDVAAGWADPLRIQPLTRDHLFPVFSVTKGVVATAVLLAVADGRLDLDAPLVESWPTFDSRGSSKHEVTLRHVLTHSAGLPQMPAGTSPEQMSDWRWMVDALEREELRWEPGTAGGYHAYTYGWLIGEPLRQVLNHDASAGELITDLLTERVGRTDFWIGLPPELDERVVTLGWAGPPARTSGLRGEALPSNIAPGQSVFGRIDVRRSSHLGAGGIGTAAAVARTYGFAASVTVDQDAAVARAFSQATSLARRDHDLVLDAQVSRGLGFRVSDRDNLSQAFPFDAASRTFGHPGAGGSVAWADLESQASFAINRVQMTAKGYADEAIKQIARVMIDAARRSSAAS